MSSCKSTLNRCSAIGYDRPDHSSLVNRFVLQTLFKMETACSMIDYIREGDFMLSVELKDAFSQLPVHKCSRKCLPFAIYQFSLVIAPQVGVHVKVCPGVSLAPFTRF